MTAAMTCAKTVMNRAHRLSVRWRLVVGIVVGGWVVGAVAGCEHGCNLAAELTTRAGGSGINCGHVALGGDREAVDACVVASFQQQQAFQATYEIQGEDSHVAAGVVSDGGGRVTFLLYDGNVGGGGGDGSPVISATACETPAVRAELATRAPGTPPFSCGTTRDLGDVCR